MTQYLTYFSYFKFLANAFKVINLTERSTAGPDQKDHLANLENSDINKNGHVLSLGVSL